MVQQINVFMKHDDHRVGDRVGYYLEALKGNHFKEYLLQPKVRAHGYLAANIPMGLPIANTNNLVAICFLDGSYTR